MGEHNLCGVPSIADRCTPPALFVLFRLPTDFLLNDEQPNGSSGAGNGGPTTVSTLPPPFKRQHSHLSPLSQHHQPAAADVAGAGAGAGPLQQQGGSRRVRLLLPAL